MEEYQILEKIGEGSYGEVYKVQRRYRDTAQMKTYAMKIIKISSLNPEMRENTAKEVFKFKFLLFRLDY